MPLLLTSYDITHPRRLRRAARVCERFGERLQDSLYVMELSAEEARQLMHALARVIDPASDRVRYIPVCSEDARASRGLGLGRGVAAPPNHWAV